MASGRGYVHRVDIRADINDVWQALIDPAILARWHVPNARVDARVGGSYWTRLDAKTVREAHIDVFQAPRRLRLIYMAQAGLPDDGGVCIDDFLLDQDVASGSDDKPNTILRLMGSGVPDGRAWDALYIRLRNGWERALLRLKVSFERREDSAVKHHGGGSAAKPLPPEEKMVEMPQSGKKQPQVQNPLLGKPAEPTFDHSFTQADSDFIQWPEPTPPKKR
jgi:Activator of Hsp90 ATPase homolog 1-like protein